jgi:hypothetical protein
MQASEEGVTGSSKHFVALDLDAGKMQSWDVAAGRRDD